MGDKLNPKKVALSLEIVASIISLVCAVLIWIFPAGTVNLFGSIFHGLDLSKIATTPTLGSTIIGVVEVFILGWVAGWLFAVVYNRLK